jgi:GNAT superfamily N-acetyltransferase
MPIQLPDFLPGTLTIEPGNAADYDALAMFHYLPKRPATWAAVWTVRFRSKTVAERIVGVGVLSFPVPSCAARQRFFGLPPDRSQNIVFANENLRTISRVIVHPQFRALGLSKALVTHLCHHCPTRFVEAMAVMGRAHPFFERAGMKRIDPAHPYEPIYYILDRFMSEPAVELAVAG